MYFVYCENVALQPCCGISSFKTVSIYSCKKKKDRKHNILLMCSLDPPASTVNTRTSDALCGLFTLVTPREDAWCLWRRNEHVGYSLTPHQSALEAPWHWLSISHASGNEALMRQEWKNFSIYLKFLLEISFPLLLVLVIWF